MAYCTIQDVQEAAGGSAALRELSDQEKKGVLSESVVNSCIAEADAKVNQYVQLRHDIPIAEVPDAIRYASARLAVYFLKRRRHMLTEDDKESFADELEGLRDIASGKATVGKSPLPAKSELVVDQQSARPAAKDVSRAKTKGFW